MGHGTTGGQKQRAQSQAQDLVAFTQSAPGSTRVLMSTPWSLCVLLKTGCRGTDLYKGELGETFQKAQKGKTRFQRPGWGELSSPSHSCASKHLTLRRGERDTEFGKACDLLAALTWGQA